jgi:hypothetical protein
MLIRHVLTLALVPALALGCRHARAQQDDDEDRRDPAVRPVPARKLAESEDRIHDAEIAMQDCEARVAQLRQVERRPDDDPELVKARAQREEARRQLDRFREKHQETQKRHDAEMAKHRDAVVELRSRLESESRSREAKRELPQDERSRRPEFGGAGPSMEQRLEALERAVREMHEMFAQHGFGPQMRDQIEREMRERRAEDRVRKGPPPARLSAGRAPAGAAPPPPPNLPPAGREEPASPMSAADVERMKAEVQRAMSDAQDQMAEMRKQLADTRAALAGAQEELKKAEAELEAARSKK